MLPSRWRWRTGAAAATPDLFTVDVETMSARASATRNSSVRLSSDLPRSSSACRSR